jgi:hypothetical protein
MSTNSENPTPPEPCHPSMGLPRAPSESSRDTGNRHRPSLAELVLEVFRPFILAIAAIGVIWISLVLPGIAAGIALCWYAGWIDVPASVRVTVNLLIAACAGAVFIRAVISRMNRSHHRYGAGRPSGPSPQSTNITDLRNRAGHRKSGRED